jgi:hypothetical protein
MIRPDIYDGEPWSESAIADLKASVARGDTLEQTASFLCRAGTTFDLARKAKELGLKWQRGGVRRKPDRQRR